MLLPSSFVLQFTLILRLQQTGTWDGGTGTWDGGTGVKCELHQEKCQIDASTGHTQVQASDAQKMSWGYMCQKNLS